MSSSLNLAASFIEFADVALLGIKLYGRRISVCAGRVWHQYSGLFLFLPAFLSILHEELLRTVVQVSR